MTRFAFSILLSYGSSTHIDVGNDTYLHIAIDHPGGLSFIQFFPDQVQ
jgi:hypothetical protein